MKPFFKYFLLIPLLALSFASCNDNIQSSIPDYPVNLQLNLTSTYPTFRDSHLHYILFTNRIIITDQIGYAGILVFTGFDGSYFAFDMACPYEANKNALIYLNPTNKESGKEYVSNTYNATCSKCGSVFDIGYGIGNPTSGPAKEALKRYRTTLSGDVLYISR